MATDLRSEILAAQASTSDHTCKLGTFLAESDKGTREQFIGCLEDHGLNTKSLWRWLRSKGVQIGYSSVRSCREQQCWNAGK